MNLNNIPEELKKLPQWVCTRHDSKIPMRAGTTYPASSTDAWSWSEFEVAKEAVKKGFYDYVGFVFNDNGIVGIDIDDGYTEDGFMSELAADIIGKCESYTEKSKSGRGFHILLKGELPFKGKNNLKGVEIYKTARYFIMTGDTILYHNIVESQEAINYIIEKYFPDMREGASERTTGTRIYSPIWEKPAEKINLRPVYYPIPDGTRNISLTSIAGQWHNMGYGKEDIYRELLYVNSVACQPPLDINEIQSIVNSVTRYKR
jgi:primase-polymerase (primpol)-like protein